MPRSKWTWKNIELPAEVAEPLALRFELGCIEAVLEPVEWETAEGWQIELLVRLGDLYSRSGEVEKGLEVDRTLVRLRPEEPIFRYNLACSLSRLGNVDLALDELEAAMRLGYRNFEHLHRDEDLDNVRGDARFRRLLKRHERPS